MASIMEEVLQFLSTIGFFDVLLPFLLFYALIFALLERTRIFGVEKVKIGDRTEELPRKNLNAIISFALSFFAIASAQIVGVLHRSVGPILLLVFGIVLFLMLISIMYEDKDYMKMEGTGKTIFIAFIAIALVLIFLASIQTDSGISWLEWLWTYASQRTNAGHVGAVILLLIVAGLIAYLGNTPGDK